MNASSAPRFAFAASCVEVVEVGPDLAGRAPAGLNVWQPPQPFCWKTASPGGPAAALPPLFSHVVERRPARGSSTWLRISAWPRPQSSVQMTGNVPMRVGVITSVVVLAGHGVLLLRELRAPRTNG